MNWLSEAGENVLGNINVELLYMFAEELVLKDSIVRKLFHSRKILAVFESEGPFEVKPKNRSFGFVRIMDQFVMSKMIRSYFLRQNVALKPRDI